MIPKKIILFCLKPRKYIFPYELVVVWKNSRSILIMSSNKKIFFELYKIYFVM